MILLPYGHRENRRADHGVVVPPPEGMDAVWELCRRWDRLYDATVQRR
jgi:hypothetical protein